MAQTLPDSYWNQWFTAATWSGGTWGSGTFDDNDGEVSPTCIFLAILTHALRQDSLLSEAFGDDGIQLMEAAPRVTDISSLPRIYVWSGTVSTDTIPTSTRDVGINIYAGLMYSIQSIRPVPLGQATLAAPLHRIVKVMRDTQSMIVTVASGDLELAEPTDSIQPHDTLDIRDDLGRPFAEMQIVHGLWKAYLDDDTGRILNMVSEVP
jgi:hypothetical protein